MVVDAQGTVVKMQQRGDIQVMVLRAKEMWHSNNPIIVSRTCM